MSTWFSRNLRTLYVHSKGRTGKWTLIKDLSYPPGYSVNDATDPVSCSLVYTMVEKVAQRAMHLGKGALMAKVDIKLVYWLIPVQKFH